MSKSLIVVTNDFTLKKVHCWPELQRFPFKSGIVLAGMSGLAIFFFSYEKRLFYRGKYLFLCQSVYLSVCLPACVSLSISLSPSHCFSMSLLLSLYVFFLLPSSFTLSLHVFNIHGIGVVLSMEVFITQLYITKTETLQYLNGIIKLDRSNFISEYSKKTCIVRHTYMYAYTFKH